VPPLIVHPRRCRSRRTHRRGRGNDSPEPAASPARHANENAIESRDEHVVGIGRRAASRSTPSDATRRAPATIGARCGFLTREIRPILDRALRRRQSRSLVSRRVQSPARGATAPIADRVRDLPSRERRAPAREVGLPVLAARSTCKRRPRPRRWRSALPTHSGPDPLPRNASFPKYSSWKLGMRRTSSGRQRGGARRRGHGATDTSRGISRGRRPRRAVLLDAPRLADDQPRCDRDDDGE